MYNALEIQICTVQTEIEACFLVCDVYFDLLNLFLNKDFPLRSESMLVLVVL